MWGLGFKVLPDKLSATCKLSGTTETMCDVLQSWQLFSGFRVKGL